MESLAALLGAVAMAAPMDAPPPPRTVVVPLGFRFEAGRVLPGAAPAVARVAPPVLLNPPVRVLRPDECRT